MSVLDAESAIAKLEGQIAAVTAAATAAATAAVTSASANTLMAQQIEEFRRDFREFRAEQNVARVELATLKTIVNSEDERSHTRRISAIELQQARWVGAMLIIGAVASIIVTLVSGAVLKFVGKG
ncbi:MAG: hypothetical protein Q7T33_02500 [Dehalococcoidia bacterium]|nr:hypothetical protein [Dehalococcoidia bacterium]